MRLVVLATCTVLSSAILLRTAAIGLVVQSHQLTRSIWAMSARGYTQPLRTAAAAGGVSAAWLASLGLVGCSISDFSSPLKKMRARGDFASK